MLCRLCLVSTWWVLALALWFLLSGCTPPRPEGIVIGNRQYGWGRTLHVPPLSQWPSCDPDQVCG